MEENFDLGWLNFVVFEGEGLRRVVRFFSVSHFLSCVPRALRALGTHEGHLGYSLWLRGEKWREEGKRGSGDLGFRTERYQQLSWNHGHGSGALVG